MNEMLTSNKQYDIRRFNLSLNQKLQHEQVNWQFAQRLIECQKQYNFSINEQDIIRRLKQQEIDKERAKQIVFVMREWFHHDQSYFIQIFEELSQEQDLEFSVLSQLLQIYIQNSYFLPDRLNTLIKNCMSADIGIYEFKYLIQLLEIEKEQLPEEKGQQIYDLILTLEEQIIEQIPSFTFPQFQHLVLAYLNQKQVSDGIKQAFENFFRQNDKLLNKQSLINYFDFVTTKQSQNTTLIQDLSDAINFKTIVEMNKSLIKNGTFNSLSNELKEVLSSLITLVILKNDKQNLKNDEQSNRLYYDRIDEQTKVITEEIDQYLQQNPSLETYWLISNIIQELQILQAPFLHMFAQRIKTYYQFTLDSQNLLNLWYFLEGKSVKLEISRESLSFNPLIEFCSKNYSPASVTFLFNEFYYNKDIKQYLDTHKDKMNLKELANYSVLLRYHKFNDQLDYTNALSQIKTEHIYECQVIYKYFNLANIKPQDKKFEFAYQRGEKFLNSRKQKLTKDGKLVQESAFEKTLINEFKEILPKGASYIQNVIYRGVEIDFLIQYNGKDYYLDALGDMHFYYDSREFRLITKLKLLYLNEIGAHYVVQFDIPDMKLRTNLQRMISQ
ncbi:hypothetical protein pb186bvf_000108 [Paramecium bursaria]